VTNIVCKIVYFENHGPENTEEALKLAKERTEEVDIKSIVVASTTGETGVKTSQIFKGYNLVVVTHVTGFTNLTFNNSVPRTATLLKIAARKS